MHSLQKNKIVSACECQLTSVGPLQKIKRGSLMKDDMLDPVVVNVGEKIVSVFLIA